MSEFTFLDTSPDVSSLLESANKAAMRAVLNVADGSTANTGTVTSVGITGAGGISFSGGPITTSGTFTLSIDAATLRTTLNVANGATANQTDAHLLSRANHTGTQAASTIANFAAEVAATAAVTANSAKVSNATHTGDVTGSTALTIADNVVSNAKLADMAEATIKGRAAGAGTGDPADLTASQARTALGLGSFATLDNNGTASLSVSTAQVVSGLQVGGNATVTGDISGAIITGTRYQTGNNIVTEVDDFTVTEATHAGAYVNLNKTSSPQLITMPASGIATGRQGIMRRVTTQPIQFSGAGTVQNGSNIVDVPVGGCFGWKCTGVGTYDFI
jgi:hypothetical protein